MGFFQSQPHFTGAQYSQAPEFPVFQRQYQQMPESQPGLMNMLAQSLGGGLGEGIAGSIQKQMKDAVLQKALSAVKPNMSPLEKAKVLGQVGPEAEPYIKSIFDAEAAQAKEQREREFELLKIQRQGEEKLKQIKAKPIKGGGARNSSPEEREALQGVFDDIVKLASSENIGLQNSLIPWDTGYFAAKGELDALTLALVEEAGKMENRGHLTERQMKNVEKSIPQANDRIDTIKGKLKGLAKILGLNVNSLTTPDKQKPVQMFTQGLPPAAKFKDRIITDPDTGERRQSNGTEWVRIQ